MKLFAIKSRQFFLATWKLSAGAVRRLGCWGKESESLRLVACLLGTASLMQGQDPVAIAPDGTVTINRMVIEPSGNATVNGFLSINGVLKLSDNTEPATAGMIRWNGRDFEGYDGKKWLPLAPAVTPVENMVPIEAGDFYLEGKIKAVIIDEFWMGKYEVTQKEYEAVIGFNPSKFKGNEHLPVDSVTWMDAAYYCAKLTMLERKSGRIPAGYEYRLPTEAEWEYACRAGTKTKFSDGDDAKRLGEYAWFGLNSEVTTHPVGQREPNDWKLYDMRGNVSEWCQDYFDRYPDGPLVDPKGPVTGDNHVTRGGSFESNAFSCAADERFLASPGNAFRNLGFRVVLAPQQP